MVIGLKSLGNIKKKNLSIAYIRYVTWTLKSILGILYFLFKFFCIYISEESYRGRIWIMEHDYTRKIEELTAA